MSTIHSTVRNCWHRRRCETFWVPRHCLRCSQKESISQRLLRKVRKVKNYWGQWGSNSCFFQFWTKGLILGKVLLLYFSVLYVQYIWYSKRIFFFRGVKVDRVEVKDIRLPEQVCCSSFFGHNRLLATSSFSLCEPWRLRYAFFFVACGSLSVAPF